MTAAWLAEQQAKQAAYAARRRHYLTGVEPRTADQDTADLPRAESLSPLGARRRTRRRAVDPRQLRLEL